MAEIINLWDLKNDIDAKKAADDEVNAENFDKEKNMTLTDEERAAIDKMVEEQKNSDIKAVAINELDTNGAVISTPISEYAKSLDDRVAELKKDTDTTQIMKAVNTGDITKTVEQLKEEGKAKALATFRSMAVDGVEDIADDDYLAINDAGLAAMQKFFGVERIESEAVAKKLYKLPLKQIVSIFPEQFVNIYLTKGEIEKNDNEARERFITTLAYLTATGPELDYLNEYIENENKLMVVSNRLIQCQSDFLELIKDEAKMSEIVARATDISPADNTFWSKYIKGGSNRVHNLFAQRAVIQDEYRKAYEALMEEYPKVAEDDPEYEIREKSRDLIQNEIDEAKNKYAAYSSVTNLELMHRLWDILVDRFKTNKKVDYKYIQKEAVEALDRIRRSKQNVPFPVYDKKYEKRTDELYKLYITEFPKMLQKYNDTLIGIRNHEPDQPTEIVPVKIDGIDEKLVLEVFSNLLLILYGRIMKNLTSNTSDKYDAIMLDAYFQIYCQICGDIYLMNDIWLMMRDFVEYTITTWCIKSTRR